MADISALTFRIGADITELTAGMRKAQGAVETAMAGASKAAMAAKAALGGIAIGALVASQIQNVKRLIDEADQLDDVAQKTGAAVEELSRLQQVARVNGTQFAEVESALVKFTKALNTIGEESGDASRAMKAIGLNIDDFKGKDPASAFIATAKALNGYEDSAGKTALALALFGKSGAQMLPMLKDTAQFHDITSKVTAQQAAEAANLNDEIRRLNLVMDQSKQVFLVGAVPALNEWVEAVRVAYQEGGKLAAVITAIGGAMTVPLDIFAGGDRGRLKSLQTDIDRERKILADMNDPNQTYRYRGAQANARNKQQERVNELLSEEFALANKIAVAEEAAAAAARANKGKKLDFALGEKKPPGAAKESPYEQELKRLADARSKALELTEVERILAEVEQKKYGVISDGQKNQLLAAAALVDLNKEDARTRKEAEDAYKKQAEESANALRREDERLNQLRDGILDLADPNNKMLRAWEDYNRLLDRGLVTVQQINAASADTRLQKLLNPDPTDFQVLNAALKDGDISLEKYREAIARIKDETKDVDDTGKDLFAALSSGFEKAALGGEKVRDVLRGIGQDIAKIILRKTVTEPIGKLATDMLGKIEWGSIIGSLLGARAEGGPVSAGAPYIVGERGPELMVPGMSGTVVPNNALRSMGGAAPSITIVQNMSFGSDVDRATLTAWGKEIKRNTIATVADLARRGGNFSAALG